MGQAPRATSSLCILGMLLATMAGCAQKGSDQNGADPPEAPLRIAAASDLQRVLPVLLEKFAAKARMTTGATFDASGRLAEQIKAGAPFDLFLAANQKFVSDLAGTGVILPDSVRDYAVGSLVLCVGQSARDRVTRLEDLTSSDIKKIAIANPEYAPYGVAARQAIERAGLWSTLEARIVRADSVRQALFYVRNGDAEAALVSRALVDPREDRTIVVDPSLYDPLLQSLGIVARSRRLKDAAALADFILGDEGRTILDGAGFARPTAPRSSAKGPEAGNESRRKSRD